MVIVGRQMQKTTESAKYWLDYNTKPSPMKRHQKSLEEFGNVKALALITPASDFHWSVLPRVK